MKCPSKRTAKKIFRAPLLARVQPLVKNASSVRSTDWARRSARPRVRGARLELTRFAMPLLYGSASAMHGTVSAFAAYSVLPCRPYWRLLIWTPSMFAPPTALFCFTGNWAARPSCEGGEGRRLAWHISA